LREVILFFRPLPILLGVLFFSLISCGKKPLERNPFLPEVRFQREIDLSLPFFNGLSFVGGSILLNDIGFNGVILFNLNGSTFLAWEATCPNHVPKSCSKLSLSGVLSECSCEGFQYSLATGIIINPSETLSPPQNLLYYQVEEYNGILRVSN
jgi:nitrite reductase/ring-hydroxylating ferredoxin subunit